MRRIQKLFLSLSLAISGYASAKPTVWCYAETEEAPGLRFLQEGVDTETAKNAARSECEGKYDQCVVTECFLSNPYAFTCTATKPCGETKIGGYTAWSSSEAVARTYSLRSCHVFNAQCSVACFPNFTVEYRVF